MKWYQIEVTETVKKTMWIEADSVEAAEDEAYEADMEKDIDYIDRQVTLLEVDYEDH